jgi:type I restriction enzyme S subunit
VRRLKFDVSKVGSGVTPKGGAEVYEQTGILFLRSQNIHFDGFRLDDVVYISQDIHEDMSNSQVNTGDVLLNITGASIGRCYFNDGELGEANVNQHVCIIRPESSVLTTFLYYILSSDIGQTQIQLEQSGSGREGLNFVALKNFTMPMMKINEQKQIVDFLCQNTKQIDALIAKNQQLIEKLTEYRTALITAATTGKIDVRGVEIGGVA